MNSARPKEMETSAPGQGTSIVTPQQFIGTANPRELRAISAMMVRGRPREELDRIAGCSNGPDLIANLRALGLPSPECLPCDRVPCIDKDGKEVRRGVYSLTLAGRRRVYAWMRRRAEQKGQP